MYPKIRDIVTEYDKNGITGAYQYLIQPGMTVDPSTWAGRVKKTIEEKEIFSACTMIEMLHYKFKLIKNEE
jgi:hypothetical protein